MSGVQQISPEALQQMLSAENMKKLAGLIAPKLGTNKKTLVYIIAQAVRIGHSAAESMIVKSLFEDKYDQILIITGALEHLYANRSVFEILGPNVVHVETGEESVVMLGYLHHGLMRFDRFDLLIMSPETLYAQFSAHTRAGGEIRPFELSPRLNALGDAWLEGLGVPKDAPIALLHVRDRGYASFMTHHFYRCADVKNYNLAIDALIERGWWVFRIGDKTSPPLEHPSEQAVDIPHRAGHANWMDVYMCGRCDFGIVQLSGPEVIVRGFRKPMLLANVVPDLARDPFPRELWLMKRFVSKETGEDMTYEAYLEKGAPLLTMSDQYEQAGIEVIENTPEELRDATLDMLRCLDGEPPRDPDMQEKFIVMGRAFQDYVASIPNQQAKGQVYYSLASQHARMADSFFDHRPGFLDWKDADEDQPAG